MYTRLFSTENSVLNVYMNIQNSVLKVYMIIQYRRFSTESIQIIQYLKYTICGRWYVRFNVSHVTKQVLPKKNILWQVAKKQKTKFKQFERGIIPKLLAE